MNAAAAGASPAPDARWQHFSGWDARGQEASLSYEGLAAVARQWPVSPAAPAGVAGLLSTSRDLWTAAWFHYEFLVVGASWSLLAVEAALRDCLAAGTEVSLRRLIKKAVEGGLVDPDAAERLDTGRRLRNALLHARGQGAWTPAMAAPVLAVAHQAVAELY